MDQDDRNMRDLLVTISNDMKWVKEWALKHEAENTSDLALLTRNVSKAHERIDHTNDRFNWLVTGGIFAVIVLAVSIWFKP